ncbi:MULTISPECIES: MarR family winged helix-turn-helix transcriptional regulator [Bacillus]|uniref:MarR family winged helix-turn-helix transcriptional regulator n=1 Tax=Bacillus TaxID=1386 RepID=UPI000BF73E37|nr:MarR family transcriptional regulator [Bacillus cereus]MBK4744066.1 MarR family transcriptional regulator [Bacillus cereus]MCU7392960.1 MarR family transcriptional regulator [Bacillus sp. ST24]PER98621.1 MarR family transcriptional regulator [Bacillus cereus]
MMNHNENIVSDIRRFNRFYTNILGLLDKHVFNGEYSLTESRVILEIGFMEECIANDLVEKLDIDRSYMSRIIAKLIKDGLLIKESSTVDNRTSLIRLTPKGTAFFNHLNEKSNEQIVKLLQGLSQKEIEEIHVSMLLIEKKLNRTEEDMNDTI